MSGPDPRTVRRPSLRVVSAVAVGLALLLALFLSRRPPPPRTHPARPPDPIDEAPTVRAVPARSTVEGARVLGINEGISIPDEGLAKLGGSSGAARGALLRRVALLRSLHAGIVRANSHTWPRLNFRDWREDWRDADAFMDIAGRAGLDVVLVIGPWPGSRTAAFTSTYLPADMNAYGAWVERVVERYDGDGLGDMPGLLRGVVAWEVDNEPDQHNAVAARGAGDRGEGGLLRLGDDASDDADPLDEPDAAEARGFETPDEYAAVLLATSAAIRRADPGALVLSGGIYRAASPAGRRYLQAVLAVPGVRAAIGGLSLHCYFVADNLDAVQRTLNTARALAPELPVWITETSVPSESQQPWVDDTWQARMVASVTGAFLAGGADRVLWHTLSDAPNRPDGPGGYLTNSLFRMSRQDDVLITEEKPSAAVFRRIAQHLEGADPASFVEVDAAGGRVLETDAGWLAFEGHPQLPRGAVAVQDLLTGEDVDDVLSVSSPAWISR